MTMTREEAARPYKDDGRPDIESVRRDFEHWYVGSAFDYVANPIGSQNCDLQWRAWLAATKDIAALSQPAWRPISEAPRDGTAILLYEDDSVTTAWWYKHWREGFWYTGYDCADHGSFKVERPTHWMPLPAPPEGKP